MAERIATLGPLVRHLAFIWLWFARGVMMEEQQ